MAIYRAFSLNAKQVLRPGRENRLFRFNQISANCIKPHEFHPEYRYHRDDVQAYLKYRRRTALLNEWFSKKRSRKERGPVRDESKKTFRTLAKRWGGIARIRSPLDYSNPTQSSIVFVLTNYYLCK